MEEMLLQHKISFEDKIVSVSGSGNVAIYAAQKVQHLGGRVVTMSDSGGYIYDEEGIDLEVIKDMKEIRRDRISEYLKFRPKAKYTAGKGIWSVKCDVALPCATENELDLKGAEQLVKNGIKAVGEGANMPTTIEAAEYFLKHKVLFAPGKAANAGGVATSALEMSQNSSRAKWSFEEVDSKLKRIMVNIYKEISSAATEAGITDNFIAGANIAGFKKVAEAMMQQGIV
jgi:glutamate dehydrogenase (NADP+)